jgi:hypothetical protein
MPKKKKGKGPRPTTPTLETLQDELPSNTFSVLVGALQAGLNHQPSTAQGRIDTVERPTEVVGDEVSAPVSIAANFSDLELSSFARDVDQSAERLPSAEDVEQAPHTPRGLSSARAVDRTPTPAVDQYQRFLVEHVEQKKMAVLDPESDTIGPESEAQNRKQVQTGSEKDKWQPDDALQVDLAKLDEQGRDALQKGASANAEHKIAGLDPESDKIGPESEAQNRKQVQTGSEKDKWHPDDALQMDLVRLHDQGRDALQKGASTNAKHNCCTTPENGGRNKFMVPQMQSEAAESPSSVKPTTEFTTPLKVDCGNPALSAATVQKNPMASIPEKEADRIKNELEHLQEKISSIVRRPSLEEIKQDLVMQNLALEAAISRQQESIAASEHTVDPNDKFFLKLDSLLLTLGVEAVEIKTLGASDDRADFASESRSVKDEIMSDIQQLDALKRRIELFLRIGQAKVDEDFKRQAKDMLAKIGSEMALFQSQLAVVDDSSALTAKVPESSLATSEAKDVSLHIESCSNDTAVIVSDARCRAKEALLICSSWGKIYLVTSVIVVLSGVLAPYTVSSIPGLMLVMLAVYLIRYSSISLQIKSVCNQETVDEEDHGNQPPEDAFPEVPSSLGLASFLIALLLLLSALAFGYTLLTVKDMMGTPACRADYRFAHNCSDPTRDDRKRATNSISDNSTDWTLSTSPREPAETTTTDQPFPDQAPSEITLPATEEAAGHSAGQAAEEAEEEAEEAEEKDLPTPPAPPVPTRASLPTIQPSGGSFVGYVIVDMSSGAGFLAFSTNGKDPACSEKQEYQLQAAEVKFLQSSVLKVRSCGEFESDLVVESYSVSPGPIVSVAFILEGSSNDIDLHEFKKEFASLINVPYWRIVKSEAVDTRRRLLAVTVAMEILTNGFSEAHGLAENIRATDMSQISAGGKVVSVVAFVTDPQETAESSESTNQETENATTCVNVLTTDEYDGRMRDCNAANICVDDMVKNGRWLSCDNYLILSGVIIVFLLVVAFFVLTGTNFALYVLDR